MHEICEMYCRLSIAGVVQVSKKRINALRKCLDGLKSAMRMVGTLAKNIDGGVQSQLLRELLGLCPATSYGCVWI